MNAYLIGNLLGRLAISYLIVWVVMFIVARLDWRSAFARTRKWYGLLGIVILFTLGVASALNRGGFQ